MAQKLTILFVSMEYPPETGWGGIGTYIACITPALAARGHEVHVLSCVPGQQDRDYFDQGVYVHRRGQISLLGLSRIAKRLRLRQTQARLQTGISTFLAAQQLGVHADVIEYPDYGAEGWVFALLGRTPVVSYLHSPFFTPMPFNKDFLTLRDNRWAAAFEHFAIRHADMVTAPSRRIVHLLKESGWLRGLDVELIPYPLDLQKWIQNASVQETPPLVIFMGRHEQNKAPEVLVEAMPLIRKNIPNSRALFIGKNDSKRDSKPYLEWIKTSAGTLEGCEFTGLVSRKQQLDFLFKSRVVVVPSWQENYSFVAIEGMAAGRPVVLTENNGVADLVRQTGAGAVVPPGDPKALAEALLPFLQDATYAAKMGLKAKAAVHKLHDPQRIAELREQLYMRAISITR